MKPQLEFPDIERAAVDLLAVLLDDQDVTVGVGVPHDWTPPATHVQVAQDGPVAVTGTVIGRAPLRCTVWAETTTTAKAVANRAHGLLLAHVGDPILGCRPALGPQPAFDPETNANLASFTVNVAVRAQPIEQE